MSLKLRVRKDTTQLPQLRWRVEVATNPVGTGSTVGEPSWVDAMVTAGQIHADAIKDLTCLYAGATK